MLTDTLAQTHEHIQIHTCTLTDAHKRLHKNIHTITYTKARTHIHTHARSITLMNGSHSHTHLVIRTHTHTHKNTHTHTHTHTLSAVGRFFILGKPYLWAKHTGPRVVRGHALHENFGILHCLNYILWQSWAYEIMFRLVFLEEE